MRFLNLQSKLDCLEKFSDGRNNNFNLIRFVADSLVIFSHSFALTGAGPDPIERLTGVTAGLLAVYAFFVVSGFLITQSFVSRGRLLPYIEARLLRVFPALVVMLVLTVFVLGALASNLTIESYFSDDRVYQYFLRNATLITGTEYFLPGVFSNNKFPAFFNGSLWTLPAELRFYLVLALLGMLGLLRQKLLFNLVCALLLVAFALAPEWLFVLKGHDWYPRVAWYFMLGAAFYINRAHIPMNGGFAISLLLLALATQGSSIFPAVVSISLAYSVLWFAYVPAGRIRIFNSIGDFSYGLYIYAFPIQQAWVWWSADISMLAHFGFSYVVTIMFAAVSWYLVEKPALSLKGKTVISKVDASWRCWSSTRQKPRPDLEK